MDRDYPTLDAEREVKYAALLLAEAYNCGTLEQTKAREQALAAVLSTHGIISADEVRTVQFSCDGWKDEGDADEHHHVSVFANGMDEVLDIKCDYDPRVPEARNETLPPYVSRPRRPGKTTIQEDLIIKHAAAILLSRLRKPGTAIGSPTELKQYVGLHLSGCDNENFCAVWLDAQHRVIGGLEVMFSGTISTIAVYPRVLVRRALELNAAAVVVCHNHPSGSPDPSRADEMLTHTLKQALALVDVRLLDHLVVGGPEPSQMVSFAEKGLL